MRLLTIPLAALAALAAAAPAAQATFPGKNGRLVAATEGTAFGDEDGSDYRQLITLPPLGKGRGRDAQVLKECREGEEQSARNDCTIRYSSPAWAPSGRRLAFDAGDSLALLNADRSGFRLLPAFTADDGQPAFAPSGRRLAFSGRSGSGSAIFVAGLGDARARRIALRARAPDWSRRNRVAFVRRGAVWSVRPNGRGAKRLAAGRDPSWSPNGRSIAFVRRRGIYVARANGARARLVVPCAGCRTPVFSPDGRLLAYDRGGLRVSRIRDGRLLRLVIDRVRGAFDVSEPDWQPR